MNTQVVFSFLEQQQLLVPFLRQPKVLEECTKEELLVLVEKLVNPNLENVSQTTENIEQNNATLSSVVEQNMEVVVNHGYRTKTIKLSLQEVYDRLVEEGITSRDNHGKRIVNKIAVNLGLIEKFYNSHGQPRYRPTDFGKELGLTSKSGLAVWYTLEAYDEIKAVLLRN